MTQALFAFAVLTLGAAGPAPAASLLGISNEPGATLWRIDPLAPSLSAIGLTHLNTPASLTAGPGGSLLTVAAWRLVKVDRTSGAASPLVDLTIQSSPGAVGAVTGLAYSEVLGLYLLNSEHGTSAGSGSYLYHVDLQTGSATLVRQSYSVGIAGGLTFGPDGSLYAWSRDQGLIAIDPATSAVHALGSFGAPGLGALASLPDGSFVGLAQLPSGLGGPRLLYRVDPAANSAVLVGDLGMVDQFYSLSGLAVVPECEAGTLLLLAVSWIGALGLDRAARAADQS